LEPQSADVDLPLRFCVQDVYRFDERRIIAGRIETGKLRVGDELVFSPANKASKVQSIEEWGGNGDGEAGCRRFNRDHADGANLCRARLRRLSHQTDTPIEATGFMRCVLDRTRADAKRPLYDLRLATQGVKCEIVSIDQVMDSSSLKIYDRETPTARAQ